MKKELKISAIKLRKQGLSYKEIKELLPISNGSLSLWLRDIILTDEQKSRLKDKIKDNARTFTLKERSKGGSTNRGRKHSNEFKEKIRESNIKRQSIIKFSLGYRKDELPIKYRLENMLAMSFSKEKIDNFYIDFANELYLIEHTEDHTKGMSEAINRLSSISDPREKILICKLDRLGSKRKREGIRYINVNDFWKEDFKI